MEKKKCRSAILGVNGHMIRAALSTRLACDRAQWGEIIGALGQGLAG